ncbi:hypothetical protein DERF_010969 [Dermatophagoides farinae]|uniref:Uncharacterized protein n=1 Tax=Dermatophagoides farinae TaxID=6954 RepID=A0A922L172_DERFA|nr:hypothetical protein DERF_010969 [Dermatophagoides farinae]
MWSLDQDYRQPELYQTSTSIFKSMIGDDDCLKILYKGAVMTGACCGQTEVYNTSIDYVRQQLYSTQFNKNALCERRCVSDVV